MPVIASALMAGTRVVLAAETNESTAAVQPAPPPVSPVIATNAPVATRPGDTSFHFHGLSSAESQALAQHPKDFWRDDTLLGDVGGWRSVLERHGFEFLPVYVGEVMGNLSGGMKQGTVYDSCLNLPLTVHLDKLAGGWDGATLYGNVLWIAGRSLSSDYVGDISGTSNISGKDTVRVQELWYEQSFGPKQISLRAGLLDADAEFFTSDTASLFINGTFGAFTYAGANLPNPPFYPMAAPALRVYIEPVTSLYFQSGVYKGNSGTQEENLNGLNYHFNGDDGVLVFSEIGWRLNHAKDDTGRPGTYKLGSFVATANFHNQITGASEGPDYGIYAVADQELYRREAQAISCFARAGAAPSSINPVDWYFDAGCNFAGFLPCRPDDVLGVAVARSWFSSDYSAAQVAGGAAPYFGETVIEATWRASILPWWTLQPDFQYIFSPGGAENSQNATVIGLRTTVVF
jgi:porin